MILTNADRRRMMTPSGRLNEAFGAPRPVGPTQMLVPVGPFSAPPPRLSARAVSPGPNAAEFAQVTVPKLDAPFIQPDGTIAIPWYQVLINIYRLTQPTGVVPGTYLGLTINPFGQVTSAQVSGITIDSPHFTNPTATTPPANDNSDAIATTQWVREQNYATESFVTSQGFATESFVTSQGFATEAWVLAQGFITDAPADGQRYVRQNGQWVVIVSP